MQVLARCLRLIADDLDKTRDLALNGNQSVIIAVGELRADVFERLNQINDTLSGISAALSRIEHSREVAGADLEVFKEHINKQLGELRKPVYSNGHSPT